MSPGGGSRSLALLSDEAGPVELYIVGGWRGGLPVPGRNLASGLDGHWMAGTWPSPRWTKSCRSSPKRHNLAGRTVVRWLGCPSRDLAVHASPQRYEALGSDESGVRSSVRGLDSDFVTPSSSMPTAWCYTTPASPPGWSRGLV